MQYEGRHFNKFATSGKLESLEPKASLSELYHENTKLAPLGARAYGAHVTRMANSPLIRVLSSGPYKVYSLMDQVELQRTPTTNGLEQAIMDRRSRRIYSGEAMSLEELSQLLLYGYGITDGPLGYRAVPSGGALYPLEIYPIVLNVEGVDPGLYHYNIEQHCLDAIRRDRLVEELKECVFFVDIDVETAAVVLMVTAIFVRSTIKYQDRGYRMILLEAGEVAQNISLMATSKGLGSCLVGGFLDDKLSDLLGIDGDEEAPLLPIVIGRLPDSPDSRDSKD